MDALTFFQSPALKGIHHGFFGRTGGVSNGLVASLNAYPYQRETGKEIDDIANVKQNRQRILSALHVKSPEIVTANQVHGDAIVYVKSVMPWDFIDADGLLTDNMNVPLGVLTADCVPVMYTDLTHSLIGIVHAGWKGAFLDIHLKMLLKFNALGVANSHIKAVVGPSIQQASYEVDTAFFQRWCAKNSRYAAYFYPSVRADHFMFDLGGLLYDDLQQSHLSVVDWVRLDTLMHNHLFFSHRSATLNNQGITGRQLSVISL